MLCDSAHRGRWSGAYPKKCDQYRSLGHRGSPESLPGLQDKADTLRGQFGQPARPKRSKRISDTFGEMTNFINPTILIDA